MKRRIVSILLSLSLVISFMPYAAAGDMLNEKEEFASNVVSEDDDTYNALLSDDGQSYIENVQIDNGAEYVTTADNSEMDLSDNTDITTLEEYNIERLEQEEAEKQNSLIPYRYDGEFDTIPEIELISDDITDGLSQLMENVSEDGDVSANHYEAAIGASKYDSRNYGIVSKVKDQGIYGTCWAHSALAAVETSVLKSGEKIDPDYSERHLAYFAYHEGIDKVGLSKGVTSVSAPLGNDYLNIGGNDMWAASRLMNSMGAALETSYPYSKAATAISTGNAQDYSKFVSGYYFIPTTSASVEEKTDTIKALLTQFGAVSWAYCSANRYYTYNSDSTAYYCNLGSRTNHAITVVGWDDNYSKYNFKSDCRPKEDGAWICKNSWGTGWGKNGYFYISYYDTTLGNGSNASVVTTSNLKYDNNYFYTNSMPLAMCSVKDRAYQYFTVKGENVQTLTAVSFMSATTNMPYSIQIYKNPVTSKPESGTPLLRTEVSGITAYAGYYNVDIPNVEIRKGDTFVVAIKCNGYLYCDASFTMSNYKYIVNPTAGISFSGTYDIGKSGNILRINALTEDGFVSDEEEAGENENPLEEDIVTDEETAKNKIEDCKVVLPGTYEYEYTGSYIKPDVAVYSSNSEKLTEGIDYTVRYKNNKNTYEYDSLSSKFNKLMAPTVIITGKGDYEGEQTVYFIIKGKKSEAGTEVVNIPMSKVKIELTKNVTYTGGAITMENNPDDFSFSVSYMGIPLVEYDRETGTGDYTVSYAKNISAGTASVTFVGKGVYTGSVKKAFKINAYKLFEDDSNVVAFMEDDFIYEKGGVKPEPEVYFKGELLKKNVDYVLSYKNASSVNDGSIKSKMPTVVIRGKGNFSGSISKYYTIEPKSLCDVEMLVPGKAYSNKPKACLSVPQLVDTNGKKLSKGSDYTDIVYTYVEDTEVVVNAKDLKTEIRYAGDEVKKTDILPKETKVLVTVTGKKNYVGENSAEYSVYSLNIAKAKVEVNDMQYNGNMVTVAGDDLTVKYDGKTLEEGVDYRVVSYVNNTKPGTAKITIWGIGTYGGIKTATFNIIK